MDCHLGLNRQHHEAYDRKTFCTTSLVFETQDLVSNCYTGSLLIIIIATEQW
jgi:hypothetical protein